MPAYLTTAYHLGQRHLRPGDRLQDALRRRTLRVSLRLAGIQRLELLAVLRRRSTN
jgi:hypothetical protein